MTGRKKGAPSRVMRAARPLKLRRASARATGIAAAVLGVVADAKGIEFVYQICSYLPLMGLLTIFLPLRIALALYRFTPCRFYPQEIIDSPFDGNDHRIRAIEIAGITGAICRIDFAGSIERGWLCHTVDHGAQAKTFTRFQKLSDSEDFGIFARKCVHMRVFSQTRPHCLTQSGESFLVGRCFAGSFEQGHCSDCLKSTP